MAWAKRHLPEQFEYTVKKLNQRTDAVSFIHCPGFDAEHEPVIAAIVVVGADGAVQRRGLPADPYIYHHKWLFVDDDYAGFDIEASKARSSSGLGSAMSIARGSGGWGIGGRWWCRGWVMIATVCIFGCERVV